MIRIGRMFLIAALIVAPAIAQVNEEADGSSVVQFPADGGPVWHAPSGAGVLVDNGPLVNSAGTGANGADESMLQTALGMNVLGTRVALSVGDRMADDFTIPDDVAGWEIDACTFFGYQTGAPTTSTITQVNLRILDGSPDDPASNVVFGDTTTNRLAETSWSNIYRVTDTTSGDTLRAVFANVTTVGTTLGPGTYWLDYQYDGSASFSGPWQPPITINGETTTGNSLIDHADGDGYLPFVDSGGTETPQGVPFICEGTEISDDPPFDIEIPTLGHLGLLALILSLAAVGIRRIRRQ